MDQQSAEDEHKVKICGQFHGEGKKTVKFDRSVSFCPEVIRTKFANEAAQSLMIPSSSDGENKGCGP